MPKKKPALKPKRKSAKRDPKRISTKQHSGPCKKQFDEAKKLITQLEAPPIEKGLESFPVLAAVCFVLFP